MQFEPYLYRRAPARLCPLVAYCLVWNIGLICRGRPPVIFQFSCGSAEESIMLTPAIKTDSPFWQLPITALLGQMAASPNGLSSAEAAARLTKFGPNLIHGERKRA